MRPRSGLGSGSRDWPLRQWQTPSLTAEPHSLPPSQSRPVGCCPRLVVSSSSAVGSEGWSVAAVLGPGGRRFGGPGTCRAVERAIASSFGLLVPYLPDVNRLTLDLEDPRRLGPTVSTSRPTPLERRQQYRLLSTSKRQGIELRRYPDGSVVTVDTTATSKSPSHDRRRDTLRTS